MRNSGYLRPVSGPDMGKLAIGSIRVPRHFLLGIILVLALLAFEAFNFDTTRYALQNLLGDVRFAGMAWATILAVAFCAIDFAGLGRLFTPERGLNEPKEIWYLTGAWLLGASMNAVMTWWAVSNVLLSHDLGNEVLSREQLLHIVPVFVAVLVWLTRILFIGAVTLAGERLLHEKDSSDTGISTITRTPTMQPARPQSTYAAQGSAKASAKSAAPVELGPTRVSAGPAPSTQPARVNRRPPRPKAYGTSPPTGTAGLHARSRIRR